jgi:hypothetical protein
MAGVTLGWNDSEAGRNYQYTLDVLYMQNTYSMAIIGDLEGYRFAYEDALYDYTVAICNCAGYDCSASAEITRIADDLSWASQYDAAAANLTTILTNGKASAYNTLTNAQQQYANSYNSTVTSTDNAINNLFNSASNSYNNACNAASTAYQSCLNGCNGG